MASQKASMELAKVGGFSPHLALIVLGDDIPGVCRGARRFADASALPDLDQNPSSAMPASKYFRCTG